jgi:hypothetical protein
MVIPIYNKLLDSLEYVANWASKENEKKKGQVQLMCDAVMETLKPEAREKLKASALSAYNKINDYYSKTDHFYTVATILDPRFKLKYYEQDSSSGAENPTAIQEK